MLSLNEKLSEVQLLRLRATFHAYFICERKFYARAHVKITRHWKSTLKEPAPATQATRCSLRMSNLTRRFPISFVRTGRRPDRSSCKENCNIYQDYQATSTNFRMVCAEMMGFSKTLEERLIFHVQNPNLEKEKCWQAS